MSAKTQYSPLITKLSWGSITVQQFDKDGHIHPSQTTTYRDAKLWPGGSRAWDWRETGTGHVRGIRAADLTELLSFDPEIIILSQGMLSFLKVPKRITDQISDSRPEIKVIVEASKRAHRTYNSLAKEGKKVAALIHSTC